MSTPSKPSRIMIAALSLSAAGIVGLMGQEGYTDTAVIPTRGDVPTVGFGSTTRADGSKVRMGDRTTPVQAAQRTLAYTQDADTAFKRCVRVPLHQAEYDTYLDFGYQYGVPTLCASSIVRNLNAFQYAEACWRTGFLLSTTAAPPATRCVRACGRGNKRGMQRAWRPNDLARQTPCRPGDGHRADPGLQPLVRPPSGHRRDARHVAI